MSTITEEDSKGKVNVVHNQPYDESLEVSDGEEIASTNATPRDIDQKQDEPDGYRYSNQHPLDQDQSSGPARGGTVPDSTGYIDEDEDSAEEDPSESEESDEQEGPHATLSGAYDPSEFEHLQVSSEIKDLFQHIRRYKPQTIELDTKLKPFVPEYIPAIGDIDAFLKVSRPDGRVETLGQIVLDEPAAKQSDPTVLDLQLRTLTKESTVKPVSVHSIPDLKKQPKALDNWINSISDLHRQKPATNVHYTKNMPDIENLMQEWPPEFEDILKEAGLPNADLDCDLAQYADIICSLLDIPVYDNKIHSLHTLFSLYMEFKNSQHFKSLATGEALPSGEPRSDSLVPEV